MEDIYEKGVKEFLEEGASSEKRGHYRAAASNYYKAVSELCSYLIKNKTGKVPANHSEIFLFLRVNFPEVDLLVAPAFEVYTKAYDSSVEKEELKLIKDAIKKIAARKEVSEEIRNAVEKIR